MKRLSPEQSQGLRGRKLRGPFLAALVAAGAIHGMLIAVSLSVISVAPTSAVRPLAMSTRLIESLSPDGGASAILGAEAPQSPSASNLPGQSAVAETDIARRPYPKSAEVAAFVASDRLAHRPAPVSEVIVPYPEGPEEPEPVSVVLTIYVNAEGRVDRIDPHASNTPDRFVEAAKAAFRGTVFTPGRNLQGPVKAQVTVEVKFGGGSG